MTSNVENGFMQTMDNRNTPFLNGIIQATYVDFLIEPGATNEVLITATWRDGFDRVVERMFRTDVWLAPNPAGFFLLPVPPDGPVAIVPLQGALGVELVPKLYIQCISNASGILKFSITDSTKMTFYFVVSNGGHDSIEVSRQIFSSDYGV